MKKHKEFIENKRIVFVTKDGRKGLPEHGPYDVIHVGGSLEKCPQEFLD